MGHGSQGVNPLPIIIYVLHPIIQFQFTFHIVSFLYRPSVKVIGGFSDNLLNRFLILLLITPTNAIQVQPSVSVN